MKKKDETLCEILSDEKIDVCVVTEIWISGGLEDRAWILGTVLNKENWCMITSNRKNNKGGGIAVIHQKGLECEL